MKPGQQATVLPHQVWNPSNGFLEVPGGPCTILRVGRGFCLVIDPRGVHLRLSVDHVVPATDSGATLKPFPIYLIPETDAQLGRATVNP